LAIIGYEWLILLWVIPIACAVWVNRDAKRRGVAHAGVWTLVAFILTIFGLLLYVIFARKEEAQELKRICPQCGLGVPVRHNFCPSCGKQFVVAQDLRSKTCMFCGRKLTQDAPFCDACGKAQE